MASMVRGPASAIMQIMAQFDWWPEAPGTWVSGNQVWTMEQGVRPTRADLKDFSKAIAASVAAAHWREACEERNGRGLKEGPTSPT